MDGREIDILEGKRKRGNGREKERERETGRQR